VKNQIGRNTLEKEMELSSAETNPHAPLRLLSLDGGGVRGLSSLMVLDDLMENIAQEEKRIGKRSKSDTTPLKPCDYFDLIGGTSTGGIIAILLSRLRLDCKQCIGIYTKLAEDIFKHDKSIQLFGVKIPTGGSRFSGAVLERAIKQALIDLNYDPDELMWDDSLFEEVPDNDLPRDSIWSDAVPDMSESPVATLKNAAGALLKEVTPAPSPPSNIADEIRKLPHNNDPFADSKPFRRDTWKLCPRLSVHKKKNARGCRGFVLTSLKNALGLPRILSTYDPNDRTTRIWEALRATSAAPTFFEEMQFGIPKVTYLDGGVGFNNPCAEVDYAAKALWEGRSIGVIVSVGTGLQSIPSVRKTASWLPFGLGTDIALAQALIGMATSTARVDNEMKRMYYNSSTCYYRFDVDRGLANVSLEQWMKEDEMAALTEQYMRDAKQLRTARQFGEIIAKLSALPPKFEIGATHFRVGMDGRGLMDQSFQLAQVDFKTGMPLGVISHLEDLPRMSQFRTSSPSGEGGLAVGDDGKLKKIYPVAEDLDHDGRREEAAVYQCMRSENICLRTIKTGIPQGRYRVQFIASFHNSKHTPPHDLVFSVGKPFDATTFSQRSVDVHITPDVVPVLLHPDAVRVRVGRQRYAESKGKGWIEIEGDVEVNVGLDGALGFVISKKFEEDVFVDGWSFGGVRLEPVFGKGMELVTKSLI
jgi:predicted acylesterase/phospholipase RssA